MVHSRCLGKIVFNRRFLAAEDVSENPSTVSALGISEITHEVIEDTTVVVIGDSLMQVGGFLWL
nr:C679 [uncultured bacterium]ART36891.1 D43 [uncultured bacterium]